MANTRGTDRGERFALHKFGKQAIIPAASASARAVFEACGGAAEWKSWISPSGKLAKLALQTMAGFLDDHPDAPAEALYIYLTNYPASGMTPPDDRAGRIFDKAPTPWAEAPMQVRGAYETFRSVYLQLWVMVRTHDAKMARALPPRPAPRLVHSDMMERMASDNGGRVESRVQLRKAARSSAFARAMRKITKDPEGRRIVKIDRDITDDEIAALENWGFTREHIDSLIDSGDGVA